MLFLLIFPVIVAGFVACHIHPYYSYKLHRFEGQYLYLKSSEMGIKCFILGFILALSIHHLIPNQITLFCGTIKLSFCGSSSFYLCKILDIPNMDSLKNTMKIMGAKSASEASKMAWFFALSFYSFVAALILKIFGHIRLRLRFGTWNSKVFVMGELLEDSPLDNLLFCLSLKKDKNIMIIMNDRKVYVGKVISLGEPTETNGMDQDISIMPLMSGYRDKDTLKVEFKTFYEEVEGDIYLSLRQDSIVSATEFDFNAYQKWNSKTENNDSSKA